MLVASARPRARLTAPEVVSASSWSSRSAIEWLCAETAMVVQPVAIFIF